MKHEFLALTVTRTSVVVHFRCIGPDDSWVRFATMRVDPLDLAPEALAEASLLRHRLDLARRADGTLPLF